jgi:heme/copper-type cytochrome/quinol oxidase subunit 2
MKYFIVVPALIVLTMTILGVNALGEDSVFELRYENHRFTPQTITVPTNRPLRIKVINASKETIEFESFKLNRERVVGPGETIIVNVPALSPGSYDFYDDLHHDVPEGVVIAGQPRRNLKNKENSK